MTNRSNESNHLTINSNDYKEATDQEIDDSSPSQNQQQRSLSQLNIIDRYRLLKTSIGEEG